MNEKSKILLQLDTDSQPSVFDAVVAIDAGVDHLLRHGGVTLDNVQALVHGGMFTRGPADLHRTAIFVGGADAAQAEAVLARIKQTFFGPLRLSVLLDPNGASTTAAAAVLSASRHLELPGATALVLGATGPVGSRVVRLLARAGCAVRVGSRDLARAQSLCERLTAGQAKLQPVATGEDQSLSAALADCQVVIAAGAAGTQLLPARVRQAASTLKVAIDLNAVPPVGIEGIEPTDMQASRDGLVCYGAIGVGGLKMKIHRRAIQRLFESNDQILDVEEVYELGAGL